MASVVTSCARSSRANRQTPREAQNSHVENFHERINHTAGVIGRNEIFQAQREQGALAATFANDIAP